MLFERCGVATVPICQLYRLMPDHRQRLLYLPDSKLRGHFDKLVSFTELLIF